jgi:hypothetical protein
MSRFDRERFWLKLNLARVDRQAVRRAFYKVVLEHAVKPIAVLAVVAAVLIGLKAIRLGAVILGGGAVLSAAIWSAIQWRRPASMLYRVRAASDSVGGLDDYAPDPGYAARTGYVHLIQTDIQRVIGLAATCQPAGCVR